VSARMAELVVGLLRLARFAAGSANLDLQDVDLRELFDTSWHAVERSAKERRVRLDQHTPSGVVVRTDRSLLSIVVANLLDNAVRFAEPDSAITCAVDHVADASSVTWTIKNRTSALETGDLARLTEPFWQKSAARTESDHAGLGLTLVNAAAQAIGAELRFRLYDEFCVDVTMRSAH
jgi:K+-sensing histidine kinase KdpD